MILLSAVLNLSNIRQVYNYLKKWFPPTRLNFNIPCHENRIYLVNKQLIYFFMGIKVVKHIFFHKNESKFIKIR